LREPYLKNYFKIKLSFFKEQDEKVVQLRSKSTELQTNHVVSISQEKPVKPQHKNNGPESVNSEFRSASKLTDLASVTVKNNLFFIKIYLFFLSTNI
jgi:hypothetical protein